MRKLKFPAVEVKGFNYHPTYSTGALEDWLLFDKEVCQKELAHGKNAFRNLTPFAFGFHGTHTKI